MTTESSTTETRIPDGIQAESTRIPDVEIEREKRERRGSSPSAHQASGIRAESGTTPSVIAAHIDDPTGTRHRGVWLDPDHWRCMDCSHTLDLSARPSRVRPTSTSQSPVGLHDPDACPQHPGQWAKHCAGCRADHLEAGPETCNPQPKGSPMPAGVRDQLQAARRSA